MNSDCVFCSIIAGTIPCHKVYEDNEHIAFLSIYPNTEGVCVCIPKAHYDSYIADMPSVERNKLIDFSIAVMHKIDAAYDDVSRTGLVFEGFGVNHIHAKLFPMHNTIGDWKPRIAHKTEYNYDYEGYLSSHDGDRMDDNELMRIAKKIRGDA